MAQAKSTASRAKPSKGKGKSTVKPRTLALFTEMFGDHLVQGSELKRIELASILGEKKVVGVYFSGHWCPPCKLYTPQLKEFYKQVKQGPYANKFEIIFVSSDRSDEQFTEYFLTMPWTALPYEEREKKVLFNSFVALTPFETLCNFYKYE